MSSLINYLKLHPLVWLIPLILVPVVVGVVLYLAHGQAQTPDSPFIYDLGT